MKTGKQITGGSVKTTPSVPLRALAGDDNEDKVIKDLIETNIRQRGDISSSSLKMGRIICELERIYGIKNGGDKLSRLSNGQSATQEELANKLGIDINTYRRSKKILELIPELQDMVDTGSITTSVASRIICELERIYGIKNGRPEKTSDIVGSKTQEDIAKE